MDKILYSAYSEGYYLDIDAGDWSGESSDNRFYFIPVEKVIYGLKFHKLYLGRITENNQKLDTHNRDFINETLKNLNEVDDIQACLSFFEFPDQIIFEEDHQHYSFFNNEFVKLKEFKLLMIYKLLNNDNDNQKIIPSILNDEEIILLQKFLTKYNLENTLQLSNYKTKDFLYTPTLHGASCLFGGLMMPIDLDAIDSCTLAQYDSKIEEFKKDNYQIINQPNLIKDAYFFSLSQDDIKN